MPFLRFIAGAITYIVLLLLSYLSIWVFLYSSWPRLLQYSGLAVFATGLLWGLLTVRPWGKLRLYWAFLLLLVGLAWCCMLPSNDRDWDPTVERLAFATIAGTEVTVSNIRNFQYTTPDDYVARYYDKTYDLERLESLDFYLVNWGIPQISHTMVSFGFEDDEYLCFSFETRREKGEVYSPSKGFFRQFELYCVVADEQDLVKLRTNYRPGEDVYLYRNTAASKEHIRAFFLEYIALINGLKAQPEWYNALTDNCMTSAYRLGRMNAEEGAGAWHWKVLLNGYYDELAYERQRIDTSLPFAALKKISRINEQALNLEAADNFSKAIREGLPGMEAKKR